MGHLLDKPETEKKGGELKEVPERNGNVLVMAATSMQGWRVEMEDAHTIQDNFDEQLPGHHFVGVFDGHGGDYTSAWIAGQLVDYIRAEPSYHAYKASLTSSKPNFEELKIALKNGFLKADDKLRAAQSEESPGDQSGSTGVVCIITPTHIICANAGDSRAVMGVRVNEGGYHELSHDHKPENEPEIARILRAGGNVSMKRVDGDLAVSRSFGDFKFKENQDLPAEEQKVTADPEIIIYERDHRGDDYLLLACDGIWDVMESSEGVNYLRELVAHHGEADLEKCAEELLDCCLEKGSQDNMTALIVQFPAAARGQGRGVQGIREDRDARAQEEEEQTRNAGRHMLTPKATPTDDTNGYSAQG